MKGQQPSNHFLEGEQGEKAKILLKLIKPGMKISGKEYYGVTNPSFKFLDPGFISSCHSFWNACDLGMVLFFSMIMIPSTLLMQ